MDSLRATWKPCCPFSVCAVGWRMLHGISFFPPRAGINSPADRPYAMLSRPLARPASYLPCVSLCASACPSTPARQIRPVRPSRRREQNTTLQCRPPLPFTTPIRLPDRGVPPFSPALQPPPKMPRILSRMLPQMPKQLNPPHGLLLHPLPSLLSRLTHPKQTAYSSKLYFNNFVKDCRVRLTAPGCTHLPGLFPPLAKRLHPVPINRKPAAVCQTRQQKTANEPARCKALKMIATQTFGRPTR